jgi:SAM-dependent methyltransferase
MQQATSESAPEAAGVFRPATHCWCGARGERQSPFSAAYFVCERCGTHFSRQRLRSAAAAADFYSLAGYWQARQEAKGHPAFGARPEIIRESGRVGKWLEALHRHQPAPQTLGEERPLAIEAGCAEGVFLESLAAEGWRCLGLEPDPATARFTAERTGLEIRSGVFPDPAAPLSQGEAGLFAACDVLEHSVDPVRFLFFARQTLREGGLIFLQMPMVEWDERPFGWIEPGVFDAQEHAFIFSRRALQWLLEMVGFEVLENQDAWIRGHELAIARKRSSPPAGGLGKPTSDPLLASALRPASAALERIQNACRGYGVEIHNILTAQWLADPHRSILASGADGQLLPTLDGLEEASLDYLFSSCWFLTDEFWRAMLVNWRQRLHPGGVLALYLPHPQHTRWHGKAPTLDPETLTAALSATGFEIDARDPSADESGCFLLLAHRAEPVPIASSAFSLQPPAFSAPARCRLANLTEMFSGDFVNFMGELNAFAKPLGLQTFTNYSKIWEYPWLWFNGLNAFPWSGARLLDVGSELSPMPWLLATLGARVHLVEVTGQWTGHWEWLRDQLGVQADWSIVAPDAPLPLPDASFDALTSYSVIEHQSDRRRALNEAARVLAPGGLLAMSFDICEPSRGMTFPAWNGQALTMAEFEEIVWRHPAFDAPGAPPDWNVEDMDAFLNWHLQSASHHRYVTAAATLHKRPV